MRPAETVDLLVGSFTGIQLMSRALTDRADLGQRLAVLWAHMLPSIAVPGLLPGLDSRADRGCGCWRRSRRRRTRSPPRVPGSGPRPGCAEPRGTHGGPAGAHPHRPARLLGGACQKVSAQLLRVPVS
ncbi:hypothetical protein GCM10020256_14260 [Streptomyces thermocoprophilus]